MIVPPTGGRPARRASRTGASPWVLAAASVLVASAAAACSSSSAACPERADTMSVAGPNGSAREFQVDRATAEVRDRSADVQVVAHEVTKASTATAGSGSPGALRVELGLEDSKGPLSAGTYYQAATNKYERRLLVRQSVLLDGRDVERAADSTIPQRVEVLGVDDAGLCVRLDASGVSGTIRVARG